MPRLHMHAFRLRFGFPKYRRSETSLPPIYPWFSLTLPNFRRNIEWRFNSLWYTDYYHFRNRRISILEKHDLSLFFRYLFVNCNCYLNLFLEVLSVVYWIVLQAVEDWLRKIFVHWHRYWNPTRSFFKKNLLKTSNPLPIVILIFTATTDFVSGFVAIFELKFHFSFNARWRIFCIQKVAFSASYVWAERWKKPFPKLLEASFTLSRSTVFVNIVS